MNANFQTKALFLLSLLLSCFTDDNKFQILAQPSNDDCENALTLNIGQATSGTTVGATNSNAGFCQTQNTSPDVWYRILGNGDFLDANTCTGTLYDSRITVFTDGCDTLTCVWGNDDECSTQSSVVWQSTIGVEYLILVHGFTSLTGSFQLVVNEVETPPTTPNPEPTRSPGANDECEEATPMIIEQVLRGTTVDTTGGDTDVDEACDGISQTGPGVWYSVEGTGTELFAGTCNFADFDTKVSVYSGGCGNLTCAGADDDGCQQSLSEASWLSNIGEVYLVMVHGFAQDTGDFQIFITEKLEPPPINDLCTNAIPIQRDSIYFGSTIFASYTGFDPCNTFTTAPGLWYTIQGTGEQLTASLCNSVTDFDTQIAIYTGTCRGLSCVGGDDDACGTAQSEFEWGSQTGRIYYIVVYGFDGEAGNFQLQVTGPTATAPPGGSNGSPARIDVEAMMGRNGMGQYLPS